MHVHCSVILDNERVLCDYLFLPWRRIPPRDPPFLSKRCLAPLAPHPTLAGTNLSQTTRASPEENREHIVYIISQVGMRDFQE